MKKISTVATIAALVIGSAASAAVRPASTSLSASAVAPVTSTIARTGAISTDGQQARGGRKGSGFVVAIALVAGIIAIIVIASTSKSNNGNSPR